jgi:TonB family protein
MKQIFTALSLLFLLSASAQDTTVYIMRDINVPPKFPGDGGAYAKYQKENLRYPEAEKAAWKEGNVTVSFVIEADGSITGAKPLKEVPGCPGFAAEAVRFISAMPPWTPGMKNGQPVRVRHLLTVYFDLDMVTPKEQAACGNYIPEDSLGYIFKSYKTFAPLFPGGDSAMRIFFRDRIKASPYYSEDGSGRIYIQFIIDSTGAVWNVAITEQAERNAGVQAAAANAICGMPRWTPPEFKGKKVNTKVLVAVYYGDKAFSGARPHSAETWPLIEMQLYPGQPRDPAEVANDVFSFAERMPEFPGNGFNKYLQDSLRYPAAEKEAGLQGTVYVSFVIEKDGSITQVQVAKAVPNAPGLSAEAIRVISSMPPWKPGMMNGKPVRVMMTQPVRFVMK